MQGRLFYSPSDRRSYERCEGARKTVVSWACKPHSHCAGVATVHPDAGQPVYRDAPGHIS